MGKRRRRKEHREHAKALELMGYSEDGARVLSRYMGSGAYDPSRQKWDRTGPEGLEERSSAYDHIRVREARHRDEGIVDRIRSAAKRLGLPWDEAEERGRGQSDHRPTPAPPPVMRGAEAFAASEEMASLASSRVPAPREAVDD